MTKFYLPIILFPALGLPLDAHVTVEVADDDRARELIKKGWIELK